MHSFFNFHIPKYFPVSPIFPNSLLNLIGVCLVILSACLFVLFVELFSNTFSTFIFSVNVMTQALFYSQALGERAIPFATFITYHHVDPPLVLLYNR